MTRFDSLAARSCVLLLAGAAALPAHAQRWNDHDHTAPKYWGTPMAPKVVYTRKTVDDAYSSANAAFWSDNFAKLDAMYDEFLDGHIRATDGTWMMQAMGRTFDDYGGAKTALVDGAFARWAAKSPGSRLRPVAEAIVWQSRAWAARGGGGGASLPAETVQI